MASENTAPSPTGYKEVHFSASDGLRLYARIYGNDSPQTLHQTPVVCLPGLTRNSADFHQLAVHLSGNTSAPRRVVCFDLRGRGKSQRDKSSDNYIIQVEADDILSGCAAFGIKHAIFIGTSRGALIIHALAAIRPSILAAAILNDAGPEIEGAGLAQIMAYQDRLTAPGSLEEAVALLRETQGRAFTALNDEDWMDYVRPMFVEKNGKLNPNFDPAIVDMLRGVDLNTPLPTLWPQFEGLRTIPLLSIRGENSSLLSTKTVEEMARRHPSMESITAEGQGHAPVLHLGNLPEAIAAFIEKSVAD
ncbi:MAG: alpha/beta hydrolase [Alphaproteobacteria bacterium]|nr:alpha/beta hydrolase [Alphaproteobacteria bacterium]